MPHIITIIKDPKGDDLIHKEWLMTNALGGFASGSISNVLTRKYHALLMAPSSSWAELFYSIM